VIFQVDHLTSLELCHSRLEYGWKLHSVPFCIPYISALMGAVYLFIVISAQ